MKGVRFYQEFLDRGKRRPSGNCLAIFSENRCPDGCYEAVGAVFFHPNSQPAGTAVRPAYLREKCKRIPERRARAIHPNLFTMLED